MYEESIKTPLIISYSNHYNGNRAEESIVSILDFGPTFLDYAGLEIPASMQGRSLRPLLEGNKPADWRTSFFYHYYDQYNVPEQFGIRTEEHKLIEIIAPDGKVYELYDLKADPKELRNVINDPKYDQTKKSLMERLQEEREKYEG
jgi:arylsulfatase A-like enzyme